MSNMLFIQKRQIMDACSDKPFKLETDNDVSSLLAFFGQVRDKAYLFSKVREKMIHSTSYSTICLWDALYRASCSNVSWFLTNVHFF
jgi:hypothetical protein